MAVQDESKKEKETVSKKTASSVSVVVSRNGEMALVDDKGRELERLKVPYGAILVVKDGHTVKKGQRLFGWDPHRVPILAEVSGLVRRQM